MSVRPIASLLALTEWFAFAGPRTTTALGVVLLGGVAGPRVYLLATGTFPGYLDAWFVVLTVALLAAALAMVRARTRVVAALGWAGGSLAASASIGVYVASRTVGLPGLGDLVGRWDRPLGTFAVATAALFLALHAALLLGVVVAVPAHRRWHD